MIEYAVVEFDIDQRFRCEAGPVEVDDGEFCAELCARNYLEYHDCGESYTEGKSFTFVLFNPDGSEAGRWKVGLEYWPSFTATKVEP